MTQAKRLQLMHDLKKMAKHFNAINSHIKYTPNGCEARESYRKLEKIYNHVMERLYEDIHEDNSNINNL